MNDRPSMLAVGDLRDLTAAAWAHIDDWRSDTDQHRFIARYGTSIVRLETVENDLVTVTLNRPRALNLLTRCIAWTKATKKGSAPTFPPREVADNLLVTPNPPLPPLERIVEVPILGADGTVHDQAGYDPVTRCFLRPAEGLRVPAIRGQPTAEDTRRARGLFVELIRDFPFSGLAESDNGEHERPHAYSVLLQPFVRALIDGACPLHLIEAPTPGTGKTLAAVALATPALGGRVLPAMAKAHGGDEWRKRLTAKLRRAPEYVLIDNIRRTLDSSALALALTAGAIEDRLLGVSETIRLPVRCVWLATGNNPQLSDEMTRRTVRIRMDAGVEFPEQRDGFKHPDLLGWAREQRGELIWAALTLARSWVVAGRPDPTLKTRLGGFEDWMRVIGGILEHADLGTILGNVDELRAANQDASLGAFLEAAYLHFGPGVNWTANQAIDLGQRYLDIGTGGDAQLAHALGNKLRLLVDRPFMGYVLRRPDRTQGNSAMWTVEKVKQDATTP